MPIFKDGAVRLESWPAVKRFFALTKKQAEWLFSSGDYEPEQWADPAAVIARIEHLIEGGGRLP